MTTAIEVSTLADRVSTIDNPYWSQVVRGIEEQPAAPDNARSWWPGFLDDRANRRRLTDAFSWTITDPATVRFVAEHAGPRLIDPMAGTGYWAYLLRQLGIRAIASDVDPPDLGANPWHAGSTHCHVRVRRGAEAVTAAGSARRTLLLSWPPMGTPDGADILAAYPGDRMIYIGDPDCTGNERMYELIEQGWHRIAYHEPVRYDGIDDLVMVYDRKPLAVAA